jgi:FAD synthase
MRFLTVGQGFRCGYRLDTNEQAIAELSTEWAFRFIAEKPISDHGIRISSSGIRQAIIDGQFDFAERFLGRPYVLDCTETEWYVDALCKKPDSPCTLAVKRAVFRQVLPACGKYPVKIVLSDGRFYEALLVADADNLRLQISVTVIPNEIRHIIFTSD